MAQLIAVATTSYSSETCKRLAFGGSQNISLKGCNSECWELNFSDCNSERNSPSKRFPFLCLASGAGERGALKPKARRAETVGFGTGKRSGGELSRRLTRVTAIGEETTEGQEKVQETVARGTTLSQLDQQLSSLANRDDSPSLPVRPPSGVSTQQKRPVKREVGAPSDGPLEWPEFEAGFLAFLGGALLLLTVVSNLLYKTFLGPPVAPYRDGDAIQSSAGAEPRYRITTLSEEKTARDAKEAARLQAIQSREAPSLSLE